MVGCELCGEYTVMLYPIKIGSGWRSRVRHLCRDCIVAVTSEPGL